MFWAAVVVLVVLVVLVIATRGRAAGHTPAEFPAWEALAEKHDLSFQAGNLVEPTLLAGSWRGRGLRIELTSPPAAELTVRAESDTLFAEALWLRREEGSARLGAVAGLQDIQIGDAKLDDLLRIQGIGDDHIQRLLGDAHLQAGIGRLFSRYHGAEVGKDFVLVHRASVREPPEDFLAIVEAVVEVCDLLDSVNRGLTGSTLGMRPSATLAPPTTLEEVPHTEDVYEPLDTAEKTTDTLPSSESVEDEGSVLDVVDDETPAQPLNAALPLLELVRERTRSAKEREAAIAHSQPLLFQVVVDSVARSTGELPASLKKGRTLSGHIAGHVVHKLSIRFPPTRNHEVQDLRAGAEFLVEAQAVSWDEFARCLVLDAVD
ncbi:MAG: hypothetical protein GY913_33520 [Proteobacteria bacterium]|nr:hypothetical protein [Pseudomonadota bacterium]MCP4921847.1 hypothetical protein [Pseudomonadota bacterium]